MKRISVLSTVLFFFTFASSIYAKPSGPYLGQKPPGLTAEIFARGIVSTKHHEHSAPAVSPDGKEIYWSVWEMPTPANPIQKIYFVKLTDNGWTTPKVAPFSGEYSDGGPCFSYDNKKLFFSSRRPLSSNEPINDRDIWFIERTDSGWGPPQNLGAPVNTERGEGSPTLTNDGTLYFLAYYEGVRGNYGIYRSRKINGKYTKPEPLPKMINSSHYDWTPFISPDETYLIFASGRKGSFGFNDLYISFNKGNNNWSEPQNMGLVINNGSQVRFPAVSPDGKYLFFNRSTKEKHDDIFWIDAKIIDKFKSPHFQPKKIFRLGVNNWYFWRKHNNGKFSGADVDVWREIARRNNLDIKYILIPNLEKLKTTMEAGSIDVFVSMRKNPEREQYMLFIEPPFRTKLKFLTYIITDSNIKIDEYEDMSGKSIATVGGDYDRINNNINIKKINCGWNPSKAFKMLFKGEVDAVHINQWLASDFFRNSKNKDKFEIANYTHSEYHACYMVMSRISPLAEKWKDRLGQTIQQMINDGTMKRIIDSYVPDWYESYPPGFQK